MTLIFQNVGASMNAGQTGKTADSGKTSEAGAGFGQALVQQMSGTTPVKPGQGAALMMMHVSAELLKGAATAGGNDAAAALLQNAAQLQGEEGEAADLIQKLLTLLEDLDKLEEAMQQDPALFEKIQAWLMQASAYLNAPQAPTAALDGAQDTETEQEPLSPLASRPETIRVAVQDMMMQLSQAAKPAELAGKTETLSGLIQSLQSLMGNTEAQASRKTEAMSPSDQAFIVTGDKAESHEESAGTRPEIRVTPETASGKKPVDIEGRMNIQNRMMEDGPSESVSRNGQGTGADGGLQTTGPVTAGQLALRDGVNMPVKPSQPVPVQQFAREMTQFVVNKLDIIRQQGFTEARISLNPEHLGQVDIRISIQNGQLVAQFMAQKSDAKDLLDQQMSQLRTALQGQGLQVEKLEVTQSSQSPSSQLYQDGKQQGAGQQQPEKRSRQKNHASDDAVTAASLTEELNEWLAERAAGEDAVQGGSFTAKA